MKSITRLVSRVLGFDDSALREQTRLIEQQNLEAATLRQNQAELAGANTALAAESTAITGDLLDAGVDRRKRRVGSGMASQLGIE